MILIIRNIEFENNCNVKSIKQITKSAYTELRKFLIKDGSLLLHPEVFMRVENTKKNCIKHQNRIKEFLPKTGTVRMVILTENQFSSVLFQEEVDLQEYHVGAKDLVTL